VIGIVLVGTVGAKDAREVALMWTRVYAFALGSWSWLRTREQNTILQAANLDRNMRFRELYTVCLYIDLTGYSIFQ
jgi:hypothetical protein